MRTVVWSHSVSARPVVGRRPRSTRTRSGGGPCTAGWGSAWANATPTTVAVSKPITALAPSPGPILQHKERTDEHHHQDQPRTDPTRHDRRPQGPSRTLHVAASDVRPT